jgi:ABC-type transport system involved in cytochrome c biogenesis permease subunit
MYINWNATTTNMLLANIKNLVLDLAPMINILAGIFFGIWLIQEVVRIVNYKHRSDFRDEMEEKMGWDLSKEQEEDKI